MDVGDRKARRWFRKDWLNSRFHTRRFARSSPHLRVSANFERVIRAGFEFKYFRLCHIARRVDVSETAGNVFDSVADNVA